MKIQPEMNDPAVLTHLLRLMMGREITSTPKQAEDMAQFDLAATYFLLEMDHLGGLERFIIYNLQRILQQLSRYTERNQVTYQGQVRGRINWPATYKARYSEDYDPGRYVCREVHRRYDTPENQLVRFVVEAIYRCLEAVPQTIRAGVCFFPLPSSFDPIDTATRLRRMETAMNRVRYNVHLREVTLPIQIDNKHLLAAANSRQEEYSLVAQVYQRYHQLVQLRHWDALIEAGRQALPLPAAVNDESKVWLDVAAAVLQNSPRT